MATETEIEAVEQAVLKFGDRYGIPHSSGSRAMAEAAVAALDRVRADDTRGVKDLRGVEHRYVGRDDAVIISGAEYLRKSRLALEAGFSGGASAGGRTPPNTK